MKNFCIGLNIKLIVVLIIALIGCKNSSNKPELQYGNYVAKITFYDNEQHFKLPFNMVIENNNQQLTIKAISGSEQITMQNVKLKADSLFFETPVFYTTFATQITPTGLVGTWTKFESTPDNTYPFEAIFNTSNRFETNGAENFKSGKYKTTFFKEKGFYNAIGEFKQEDSKLFATFITQSGDYRFLEGVVDQDSLKFSGFDGSNAYLFLAKHYGDSISGMFKASHKHKVLFTAAYNNTFELENADSLTFLKPGYDSVYFNFPDLEGNFVTLADKKFENKVVLVQISGSWCPNCMDETKFLEELYNTYHQQGLEIVSLFFERTDDFQKSVNAINRLKNHFNVPYTTLYAGSKSQENTAKALPMLNSIKSFPTLIFLSRNKNVVKIHTGFTGPGTSAYNNYVDQTTAFVEQLLAE